MNSLMNRTGKGVKEEMVKQFGSGDYVVLVLMLAVSALIGVYYAFVGCVKSTTKDLLLGGKSMPVFPVAMSILASFMSGIVLLGTPAEIYAYGTQYWTIVFGFFLVIPAAAYVYLPIFYKLQLTSIYEYLEIRFNRFTRSVASAIFVFQMILYMAVVLYAPSLALSQVTGITVWTSVLSVGSVCTFYTTIGGIKAVIWTNLLQVLMMFAAVLVILIKGIKDKGGISDIWRTNYEGGRIELFNFHLDPRVRYTVWSQVIGGCLTWLEIYGCNQIMVQRYLSISNIRGAQKAIWWNLPGVFFLLTICSLSGMIIYTKYRNCDPIIAKSVDKADQIFPLFVMDTVGHAPGVPGIFVAGVFSGTLSTVSSGVNSLAAVTLEDLIKAYFAPGISELWATRLTRILALLYGTLSILFILVIAEFGQILQASLSFFGMIGGPLLGLFTLGMFFPWPNSIGAVSGLVSGLILSFWIGVGNVVHKPIFPMLNFSTSGCPFNVITSNQTTTMATVSEDSLIELYKVSYMWYGTIGCLTAIIIGLIISFVTGPNKADAVDPKLMTPFFYQIFFWLPSGMRDKLKFGVNYETTVVNESNYDQSPIVNNEVNKTIDFKQLFANLSCMPSKSNLSHFCYPINVLKKKRKTSSNTENKFETKESY